MPAEGLYRQYQSPATPARTEHSRFVDVAGGCHTGSGWPQTPAAAANTPPADRAIYKLPPSEPQARQSSGLHLHAQPRSSVSLGSAAGSARRRSLFSVHRSAPLGPWPEDGSDPATIPSVRSWLWLRRAAPLTESAPPAPSRGSARSCLQLCLDPFRSERGSEPRQ